jgi:hypothetical protein
MNNHPTRPGKMLTPLEMGYPNSGGSKYSLRNLGYGKKLLNALP